ncbi:NnrS family protein [Verrucomicrobium sp. 3C]|uniref:NnrS family protein n=1 Tax=Verrucomicrobium sp. 3C TaxID=1134055 RepID=UPI00035D6E77|nr:NnrS family protein [Verrucomicrobium sp. 3C]
METELTPELTGPLPPAAYLRRCIREPYRILFPLGTVFGFLGVAVWPLAALGWAPCPPAQSHARLMIEGFVGSFLIGFLGTSLPRLLKVEPLSGNLLFLLCVTLLTGSIFQLLGGEWAGDLLFSFSVLLPLAHFLGLLRRRKGNPPPSFVLVLLGAVGAVAGAFLQGEKGAGMRMSPLVQQFSSLLLLQGFPLLPLLGLSAFFLPRLYAEKTDEAHPAAAQPSRGWIGPTLLATGAGLLIVGSFLLEASGKRLVGGLLCTATAAGYLAITVPASPEILNRGTVTVASGLALALSVLGLLLASFLDPVGSLHVFFLGGIGLMILAVGARVVYGLSGRGFLLRFRFIPFEFAIGGVVVALLARIAADRIPAWRSPLLSTSALLWMGALALWAVAVLPFVLCPDAEKVGDGAGNPEA